MSRDWSESSLGPIERWPAALTHAARICLESRFPFAIAWGAERVQLYNDAFASFCGAKHPSALGQDLRECWQSAWPVLESFFDQARQGESSYLEDSCLFLDRAGALEETFATFSFSPLRENDEKAAVAGVLLTLLETTEKVLGERRTVLLRDVVTAGAGAPTIHEALARSVQVLDRARRDVPFALVYSIAENGAELVAHTRLAPSACRPARLELTADGGGWAGAVAAVVASNRPQTLDDLQARFQLADCGPYPEPPAGALLLPITLPGAAAPRAVLIAAQSPRLTLNHEYRAFFQRLSTAVLASVVAAHAHEAQRQRAEDLAALDRSKTAFFSNVSHEFRTPLTLVVGPLDDELAEQEQLLTEARRERLTTARRNAQRLLKLVNTLLDFSRLEAGRTLARFRPTQLGTLTSELASLFRPAIERAGLTLVVEIAPLSQPVFVDRDMWEKIVLNLLSNAFKHTFEGSIQVRIGEASGVVKLSVTDTGVGIAEQQVPNLFERFHRVIGAKSRTHEGTGIGLALVRELARLHGGDAQVQSVEGQGSTFSVTLPLGAAHLPSDQLDLDASSAPAGADVSAYVHEALQWSPATLAEASTQTATGDARTHANVKLPKVLLADDNADMRAYISGILADAYLVAAVADGQAALEQVHTFRPDLVLADVMMPRLSGNGLLRALRDDERTRQLPVIFLSARAGEDAAIEGLDAGADDYLSKPFSARELRARVRTHIALSCVRRERAEQLEQSNQELEAFSYSVSHDLRTPLRAIDGFSNAILTHKADRLDEEGKDYLQRVRRAAARMGELIDELLNLSRVSRAPLSRCSVSFTKLATQVAASLHELQPTRNVAFEAEADVLTYADPRLLRIVLENLLDNAWKFTGHQPSTKVRVGRIGSADEPTFFVEDNGAGFDQTYAQRLFQPFQRLHLERDYPGTGIGLAIVHRIVSRHGGRVWAEGRENRGATFYFTLPEPA